ncbi:MAG: preprotein translocase subunit YajC [Bauldia sp.]
MWVTPAFAQEAAGTATGTASSGSAMLLQLVPFLFIFVIMYFLLIRPQRTKMRQHQEMIKAVRRGDTIVTNGGLVGKISKVVDESEIELQIAENTKIRVLRAAIAEVRAKGEPVKEDA